MGAFRDALVGSACRALRLPFLLQRPSPLPPDLSRILVLKPCCLGDVLMATAALAALRARYPRAHLAFAVGPWAREALANNPRLDETIDCGSVGSGGGWRWGEYWALVQRLRAGRFAAAFVLDRSPLLTLLPFLAGIPHRVGLDSGGRGFSLTIGVPAPQRRHEAELYLDTLRAAGIQPEQPRLEFFPSPADREWAREALAALPERPVALCPGGGVNPGMALLAKRWRPQGFAAIAARLLQGGGGVVLMGAESDREAVEMVKGELGELGQGRGLLDVTGRTTLGQLGAVLEGCSLLVANDCGPMHLAVAVGTPVVALFGPSDPRAYGPFDQRSRVVYKGLGCSPCFRDGRFAPVCSSPACMEGIGVEEVWREVEALLGLVDTPRAR